MHLIQYLLFSVWLLTLVNLQLWIKSRSKEPFMKIMAVFNAYLSFHALYVIIIGQIFPHMPFLDRLPFALMYGPFLFFGAIIIHHNTISTRTLLAHSILFILFFIWFNTLLFSVTSITARTIYAITLSIAAAISFMGYALWAIVYISRPMNHQLKQRKLILLIAIILLFFMSLIAIITIFYREQVKASPFGSELLRMLVYGCMLCCALLIFRFEIHMIFNSMKVKVKLGGKEDGINTKSETEARYEKSTLSAEQLDDYSQRLDTLMQAEKVYLQNDLSLQKLAKLMRIPNHHLTQVLNLRKKLSFYEYVNRFRVDFASTLMRKKESIPLEIVAQRSGFNSKATFYRNFKSVLGCTPSQYRLSNRQNKSL